MQFFSFTTPLQEFQKSIRFVRLLAGVLDIDALSEDYHPSMSTTVLGILVVCFDLCCVYTINVSDLEYKINCASYLAVGLQGPTKIYAVVRDNVVYRQLIKILVDAYECIQLSKSAVFKEKLLQFGHIFQFIFVLYWVLLFGVFIAIFTFPASMLFIFDIPFAPMIPSKMPFVDETQMMGYALNTGFHIICLLIVLCGNAAFDVLCMVLVLHIYLMSVRLTRTIDVLEMQMSRCMDPQSIRRLWRKVLVSHQSYNDYVKTLAQKYYMSSTVDLYTNALSLCMLVYVIQMV